MTKYPLSKEPISAFSASEYLKKIQNNMVSAARDLSDAISSIKSNLYGSEFDAACVYINDKILCNLSNVVDDVNDILRTLTSAVNVYNDDIYDADGVKYYVEDVNYESGITLEFTSSGGVKTTDTDNSNFNTDKSTDTNNNANNNTNYNPTYYSTGGVNSDVADADSVSSLLNISQDTIHLIINHSIKNIGTSVYDVDSVVSYENSKYKWDLLISLFLEKHELDDYIKKITFKDTVATIYLKDNSCFDIMNVQTYNDILTGIEVYKGKNLVDSLEEEE